MKPKIYIAGPISSDPDYLSNFQACQDYITSEGIYDPINPAGIINDMIKNKSISEENRNESWYMKLSLHLMLDSKCNDIVMLPKFWRGRASIELNLALDLKYNIHQFLYGKRELI